MERATETELARQLLSGNPEAFDRFVEHFRTKIFRYSWMMCGQREDAEEVAQETLLKVFENSDSLEDPERIRPWVFRIARNACLMKRRKSVFAPEHELSLDELLSTGGFQAAGRSPQPDQATLSSEVRQALNRSIQRLPENYRSVLLMRDVEELTTQETAHVLDLSEDVVRTRLHRARLALRHDLGGVFGGPEGGLHGSSGAIRAV